jgi:hypothetical protein
MQIEGDSQTRLIVSGNGLEFVQPIVDLCKGARSYHIGGFVSPALSLHRAVPETETSYRFGFLHHKCSNRRDWYTVRVRQRNDQWAWSSPIWVGDANE